MNNKLKVILQEQSSDKKNKSIEDITKKIQKIDKLKRTFKDLRDKIIDLKLQVEEKSKAEKLQFCITKEKYLLLLIEKYKVRGMTEWQKDIIAEMITEEHNILTDFEYKSDKMGAAFSAYVKQKTEEMTDFEKEMTRQTLADMMAQFGFEDDGENQIDFMNMHDPKIRKEFEEKMNERIRLEQEKQKELEKQKQVAKTDIDFQKVYKKLAKITHPDLYITAEEKEVKETQMQQLTKAWNERNYYDLLMVWLEVDPNNTIELEITAANQKNIIKQLNEQINKIELETYQLKFQDRDTSFYYQNFYAPNPKTTTNKIKNYVLSLALNTEATADFYTLFKKTTNLKKHLKRVYYHRNINNFGNFEM